MNMKDINRKLPTGLAISAGIMLLIMGFLSLFLTIFTKIWVAGGSPAFLDVWFALSLWITIPMSVVLFCRTKSIFAGCVFAYYGLGFLTRPLICGLMGDVLPTQWIYYFDIAVLAAFAILIAIACFGGKKQLLRKVRWLFIVLPLLLPVVEVPGNLILLQLHPSEHARTMFQMWIWADAFKYLAHLLIGLAFFFSYPKQQAAPSFHCCRNCGNLLSDGARFCTECGQPTK